VACVSAMYFSRPHRAHSTRRNHDGNTRIERMRHDGCGGQAGLAELITAIPTASRPVRRIVLIERADC
jgi:hypothetical protein